ncbi:hypothetical protein ACNHKD_12900 [Methylocystis sp. JAN1]|uniref:hypothetical protein n=1 Tax=Methylocystis sp. JAN1 TaxID=3397211 RepID=UPI003FA2F350
MAATIKQDEEIPASYPAAPSGLSKEAAAVSRAMIWQRIESYIARRWTPREVVWIVEGAGEWLPPLSPTEVTTTEIWEGVAWVSFTPTPSPSGGYMLHGCGPYRFTASVGGGDVPAAVNEAFRRLAEYSAQAMANMTPGIRSEDVPDLGGSVYDNTALARAMDRSGAGDLLRPYRRAN